MPNSPNPSRPACSASSAQVRSNTPTKSRPKERRQHEQDRAVERQLRCPGSAEGRVGEHLNDATITWLGSILECGNITGQANCRHTPGPPSTWRTLTWPTTPTAAPTT